MVAVVDFAITAVLAVAAGDVTAGQRRNAGLVVSVTAVGFGWTEQVGIERPGKER